MKFYFYPADETAFKDEAVGNYVRTLVFKGNTEEIVTCFTRKVGKRWEQTVKNNIETDHRIKEIDGAELQIYSWVTTSKDDFGLPQFGSK